MARAVSGNGVIVGETYDATSGLTRAARWNPDGSSAVLPALPGDRQAWALGVNGSGVAVGVSFSPDLRLRAVRWDPDGTVRELPPLPGDTAGRAGGINDDGEIVGVSGLSTPMGPTRRTPVRWKADGTVTALPVLSGDDGGEAHAVDELGAVVGESTSGGLNPRAVRWSSGGTATSLGAPANSNNACVPAAVDAGGGTVGQCGVNDPEDASLFHAVRWN
ncbi:hypothetical protein [Streptomyces sp. NPDC048720]|uniref:hypothetical protein n=1 Tax=Streptomyces sp. NPDC048720 TaxID=3365588 RepID=UPI003717A189